MLEVRLVIRVLGPVKMKQPDGSEIDSVGVVSKRDRWVFDAEDDAAKQYAVAGSLKADDPDYVTCVPKRYALKVGDDVIDTADTAEEFAKHAEDYRKVTEGAIADAHIHDRQAGTVAPFAP